MDEICPYATFELAKQPQGESTFSGNIYSGPYHSVRGSFVYHQPKASTSEPYNFVQVNKISYLINYKNSINVGCFSLPYSPGTNFM